MFGFGNASRNKRLEEERLKQEHLIQEQMKDLKLEHEMQMEKITQRGMIAKTQQQKEKEKEEELERQKLAQQQKKKEQENAKAANGQAAAASSGDESNTIQSPQEVIEGKKKMGYIEMARLGYQELVNAIIRPPRASYDMGHLGPAEFKFCGRQFRRTDGMLMTERGHVIECSHWEPGVDSNDVQNDIPVLIYMHGNASCRLEVLPQLSFLLSLGIGVFAFDFAGSGKSDGEFVSLGYYEREDLKCVVTHLRAALGKKKIALWGRSMGAATALMYGHRDPDISCMILDSSFCNLVKLAEEMVEKGREQGIVVPNVIVSVALRLIQGSVEKQAKFNINDISPMEHVDKCDIPALFVVGEDDDFIQNHHSEMICEKYRGHNSMLTVPGDHNAPRPKVMFDASTAFLRKHLELSEEMALQINPKMNLMRPPWYHWKWDPTSISSKSDKKPEKDEGVEIDADESSDSEDDDSDSDSETQSAAANGDEDDEVEDEGAATGFDSNEMGMTNERQQEIQSSLFKMLGQDDEEPEQEKEDKSEGVSDEA